MKCNDDDGRCYFISAMFTRTRTWAHSKHARTPSQWRKIFAVPFEFIFFCRNYAVRDTVALFLPKLEPTWRNSIWCATVLKLLVNHTVVWSFQNGRSIRMRGKMRFTHTNTQSHTDTSIEQCHCAYTNQRASSLENRNTPKVNEQFSSRAHESFDFDKINTIWFSHIFAEKKKYSATTALSRQHFSWESLRPSAKKKFQNKFQFIFYI